MNMKIYKYIEMHVEYKKQSIKLCKICKTCM